MGDEVFHSLKNVLKKRGLSTAVGDEGGFAPELKSVENALDLIILAIDNAGYVPGRDVMLALDCASSEFYSEGFYDYRIFEGSKAKKLTRIEQVDYLKDLVEKYPIDSIEDGMSEDDWTGWELLTAELGPKCQLVGDDLFVTNTRRLARGISENAGNAILIKPNQIGTLTETLRVIHMAKDAGYNFILSHRSGETEDTTLADIAVGLNAPFIKTGAPCRGERVAKYNRLLRIEASLNSGAAYGKKCAEKTAKAEPAGVGNDR